LNFSKNSTSIPKERPENEVENVLVLPDSKEKG
jgi:hypothetical protein